MLYTILQIIAFQALFLLVYDLFLKRETFFNYNRAYLLITALLSLVLPFVKFPELKKIATKDLVIELPEVFIGTRTLSIYDIQIAERAGIVMEQPETPIWKLILITGIAIASFIFLFKIAKLYWLKHNNPKRWQGNVLVVRLIKSSAAFSFFNTIFLGERIPEQERPTIFQHELVHIKELHSIDLLFFEVLRILFWFNPLVYMYQNRIKELHEYIADANAVAQNGKSAYYQSLLNQVFDAHHLSFTNTFFKSSLIKKRITMLQKSKSKELNVLKYALLIPLVFGMLIYTSTEVRAQQKTTQETLADQELTDDELIKKHYDEFVEMEKNGAAFFETADSAGFGKSKPDKYILSKAEFLKHKAYMQYIADGMIKQKSENNTLEDEDFDAAELMKKQGKSYSEYREWKKTDEAKDLWEANSKHEELRLVVNDLGNKTGKEQKRFDDLLSQLNNSENFSKLIVCEANGGSKIVLYDSDDRDKDSDQNQTRTEIEEVPFSAVDESPTLVECKDLPTNQERKNCMNSFVNKHLAKNFNISVADSLSPGRKRIFVQFKIDTSGYVTAIKARGPSEDLEEEAKRVVSTLPKFVPGRQKGKLVTVPFSVPIVFQVKGDVLNVTHTIDDSLKIKNYDRFIKQLQVQRQDSIKLDQIPFSAVEVAPIHRDCKSITLDAEQRKCTSQKVAMLVNKNFNTNMAKSLDLPSGKQRIFVQFVIDKQGDVKNIVARGPNPKLEEEAVRVLELLPQFTPGEQDGEVVNVPFSLPIVFQMSQSKKN